MRQFVRRMLSLVAMLAIILSCGTGCGNSPAPAGSSDAANSEDFKPVTLRLANVSTIGDPRDQAAVMFADLVKEKTAGKVTIEVYSGGTLGGFRDTVEGLSVGTTDIVVETLSALDSYNEIAFVDMIPFAYRDDAHYEKVWSGELGAAILKDISDHSNFTLMGPQYRGPRYITSKAPIYTADDMQGMKIRVPGSKNFISIWEDLGTAPISLDPAEIYTGLQQGAVAAQENPLSASYGIAMYDVCPYLIGTKHMYPTDVIIMDKAKFASFPEDIQTAFFEAAQESAAWRTEFEIASQQEYIEKFEEKGVTYIEPDIDSFASKLTDFYEKTLNPEIKAYYDQIQAIQ